MRILFTLAVMVQLITAEKVYCQSIKIDSIKMVYEKETIFLVGHRYYKNNEKNRIGFLGKRLIMEFKDYPGAKAEINNYRKHTKQALLFYFNGMVFLSAAWLTSPVLTTSNFDIKTVAFLSVSLVNITISMSKGIKANKNLNKAVWLYNRDVLLKSLPAQ